jgi:hypothetical protein
MLIVELALTRSALLELQDKRSVEPLKRYSCKLESAR